MAQRHLCACLMGSISFPCHGLVADKGMQQDGGYCCFIERDSTNTHLGITRAVPRLPSPQHLCTWPRASVSVRGITPLFSSLPLTPVQGSQTDTKDAGKLDVLGKQSSRNAPWSAINVCRRKLIECCVSKEITITIITHIPSN